MAGEWKEIWKRPHYWELEAIWGGGQEWHNLRVIRQKEILKGHCRTIHDCTGGGIEKSLKAIQELFKNGHETKDDYANALQAYQAYTDKIKSDQRDKAAAFSNDCNY